MIRAVAGEPRRNGGGSPKYLETVNFAPLPPEIAKLSKQQIDKIRARLEAG